MSDMEELKEKMAVAINESIWGKAMDSDPRSLLMAAAALRAIEKAGFAIVPKQPTPQVVPLPATAGQWLIASVREQSEKMRTYSQKAVANGDSRNTSEEPRG